VVRAFFGNENALFERARAFRSTINSRRDDGNEYKCVASSSLPRSVRGAGGTEGFVFAGKAQFLWPFRRRYIDRPAATLPVYTTDAIDLERRAPAVVSVSRSLLSYTYIYVYKSARARV